MGTLGLWKISTGLGKSGNGKTNRNSSFEPTLNDGKAIAMR